MNISQEQKEKLKSILSEQEFEELMNDELGDFFSDLHLLIVAYMGEDYEYTEQSNKLQKLYDDLYRQN